MSGAAIVVSIGLTASCDTQAQFAPSLPRVVGVQTEADGSTLRVLTGAPCADVARLVVLFGDEDGGEDIRTIMEADPPQDVEQFDIDTQVAAEGFEATEDLPGDFDWRDHSEMRVILKGPGGVDGVATSDLGPIASEGAERAGDGTAYIQDEGWLTPQEIADGDTNSFLAACTPDPEP